jgi:hypothetical protein
MNRPSDPHDGRRVVRLDGKALHRLRTDERGGMAVLLLGLLAILTLTAVWLASVNWGHYTLALDKAKPMVDQATRAASLDVDPVEVGQGRLVWNEAAGRQTFYTYLYRNLQLDSDGNPQPGSILTDPPKVQALEFVTSARYPVKLHRSVTLDPGTSKETVRGVDVTIYGPSVLAIVELSIRTIGRSGTEQIVLSSVSSIRYR